MFGKWVSPETVCVETMHAPVDLVHYVLDEES